MGAGQVGAWVAAGRREGPSRLEKEGHGLQRRGGASGQLGQHCGASGSDGTTSKWEAAMLRREQWHGAVGHMHEQRRDQEKLEGRRGRQVAGPEVGRD